MTTKEAKMGHRERLQIVTVKTKKRRRKNVHLCERCFIDGTYRDEKRNEREKEFVKVEVRERLLGENAKEMKARWKSEARRRGVRRRVGAFLGPGEGWRVRKENARDHRRDDGEYGNNNINNNGKSGREDGP